MCIQIIITDDHPLIINGLRNLLNQNEDMKVLATYNNGSQLLEGLKQHQPDVLLLDIQMPNYSGEELAHIISREYPAIKMITLTNQDSIKSIKSMLHSGVSGYVLKSASEEVLLEAIRKVYKGEQFLESEVKDKIIKHTLEIKKELDNSNPAITRREKQVLQLVAANYTSQEIAQELCISKRTVDNHRLGLLMKFSVKNSAGLVKKAIDLGLIE